MNKQLIDFVLLIPCYNNSDGLARSLKSVVYTKNKFEVVIVDDGSTPPINAVSLQEQFQGTTIHVIRLEQNKGIVNALNTGLNFLKSRSDIKYIARLDAGDTCDENRFFKQVGFLDTHAEIALLGSWARFENALSGKGYDYITKTSHEEILKEMHFKCSFIHPSVMFRRQVLNNVGIYLENYPHAEDYAFFWNILKSNKGAILPEKLVVIIFSDKNVSAIHYKKQLNSRKRVVKDFGTHYFYSLLGNMMQSFKAILPLSLILKLKSNKN